MPEPVVFRKEEQVNALRQENQEIRQELEGIKKRLFPQPLPPVGTARSASNGANAEAAAPAQLYQNQPAPYFVPIVRIIYGGGEKNTYVPSRPQPFHDMKHLLQRLNRSLARFAAYAPLPIRLLLGAHLVYGV